MWERRAAVEAREGASAAARRAAQRARRTRASRSVRRGSERECSLRVVVPRQRKRTLTADHAFHLDVDQIRIGDESDSTKLPSGLGHHEWAVARDLVRALIVMQLFGRQPL